MFKNCFGMDEFSCSAKKLKSIVTGVFAPYSKDIVFQELKNVNFISVFTDASNHGANKIFPIVVRYFDPLAGVKINVLDISSEPGETSQVIFELIQKATKEYNVEKKIVAFCGDNAKVNFGGLTRGGTNMCFMCFIE